jgi:hypothetical protein
MIKSAIAQTYKADKTDATIASFKEKSVENNYLSASLIKPNYQDYSDGNTIFIQQIGDDNTTSSNTRSKANQMNLSQFGDDNTIYLDISADIIDERVLQKGDNNYFYDFSPYDTKFHSAEVVQKGNNQNITFFGGNSISEKLKVNMQGDGKTIIVRNFN